MREDAGCCLSASPS